MDENPNDGQEARHWVVVREYASQLEADIVAGILVDKDVPFHINGPPVGVFGPGYSGPTAAGVQLLTPDDWVERVLEILDGSFPDDAA